MTEGLYTAGEVADMIRQGMRLLLAGDETLLDMLPAGQWIGGTIPYFMGDEGGVFSREKIFVQIIPDYAGEIKIIGYDQDSLPLIAIDEFENGYTVLIIPGFSELHSSFAENSGNYEHIFNRPLLGWVAGVALSDIGKTAPKIYNGLLRQKSDKSGVAMHIQLPPGKNAVLDMINIFRPGGGDVITFENDGFVQSECLVNGVKRNFAEYAEEIELDPRVPLVADYYGAIINTSFNYIDMNKKEIGLFAPVFRNVEYCLAAPVEDYVTEFRNMVNKLGIKPVCAFNCALNYIHSGLEGRKTSRLRGPFTFGEIAYQLLNQTLIYLVIEDVPLEKENNVAM